MMNSTTLRSAIIILGCIALGALFILGIFSNFGALLAKSTPFPINMHSSVQANYQKDPDYMQIPPMDIQLVIDAVWDQNLSSQNLSLRLTQVNDNFLSSVASVTPRPSGTITVVPEITVSATEGGPTATIDQSPSSTPTETPIGFIASPTSTGLAETPTITVLSPTNTQPAPSDTSIPPTNTVSPCGQLSIGSFNAAAKKVTWRVVNNSSTTVYVNSISLSWPASNGNLANILFKQSQVWSGSAEPPSISINPGSPSLQGNETSKLDFIFIDQAVPSGYNVTVNLSGCVISNSN